MRNMVREYEEVTLAANSSSHVQKSFPVGHLIEAEMMEMS